MNYIWDIIIKARQLNIPTKNINFLMAKSYSPYMELSNMFINFDSVPEEIEINPYYRFYEIFKDIYDIDNDEDIELKDKLFDILVHFLGEIDIRQGMNRNEYYMKFILEEIEELNVFNIQEIHVVTNNILKLYTTGEMLYFFKDTVKKIFKNSFIYTHNEEKNEILIFINKEANDEDKEKLEFIKDMFLPIRYSTETYWRNHFGVIGVDESMIIDNIKIY